MRRWNFSFGVLFAGWLTLSGCGPQASVERLEWPVMGTVAAVQVRAATADELAVAVRTTRESFSRIERLLNAHDPNSELSRLAALSDEEILAQCDESVRPCYEMAFELMRKSGGAFNPRWRGPGTLDLGAIAKGFAVDCAAADLGWPINAPGLLLDLGGNLFAVTENWRTQIAGTEVQLPLNEGMACATSAEYFRGKHIYDGRTGLAVSNGVRSVTVVFPGSAMQADGLSTTLFVLGPEEGRRFLDEQWRWLGVRVFWFLRDGRRIEYVTGHGKI